MVTQKTPAGSAEKCCALDENDYEDEKGILRLVTVSWLGATREHVSWTFFLVSGPLSTLE